MTLKLTKINRPWGYYEDIHRSITMVIKRIVVYPGQQTSLQKHCKRVEYWGVSSGKGKMILGEVESALLPSNSIYIPKEVVHRIINDGTDDLVIFETQIGVCEEDDIIRIEDDYGR